MNQIVSLSGGKDSTAMLHMMLEKGEPIHSVVFFDTGWEFPQMYDHLDLIEQKTGIEIIKLKPEKSFLYWMLEHPIKSKKTGKVHRIGYGWPWPKRRWCTRGKMNVLYKYARNINEPIYCVGFAYDERHRCKNNSSVAKRHPLIEYRINEKMALEYCKKLGYLWDGLYDIFDRVSCFCCPLSVDRELIKLKKLRHHFPDLWDKMLTWDRKIQKNISEMGSSCKWGWFFQYYFLADIEKYLAARNKQLILSN